MLRSVLALGKSLGVTSLAFLQWGFRKAGSKDRGEADGGSARGGTAEEIFRPLVASGLGLGEDGWAGG